MIDFSQCAERLGIQFKNNALIQQALTHSSYTNEHPDAQLTDNERLEFLGDAVIDFLAGELLFRTQADEGEGRMTRLRAAIVRDDTLAEFSRALGIDQLLIFGKGEERIGGRTKASNLGSAFEAVVGAVYLDQGIDAARQFATPHFEGKLRALLAEQTDRDAKSQLQELVHAQWHSNPVYTTTNVTGPDHQREYTVEVRVNDQPAGIGVGKNKQSAQQQAASNALKYLREQGLPVEPTVTPAMPAVDPLTGSLTQAVPEVVPESLSKSLPKKGQML